LIRAGERGEGGGGGGAGGGEFQASEGGDAARDDRRDGAAGEAAGAVGGQDHLVGVVAGLDVAEPVLQGEAHGRQRQPRRAGGGCHLENQFARRRGADGEGGRG